MDSDANLIQRIEKIKDPIQKEIAMTAAQHLERRGLQQGIRRGRQEGRQEGKQEGEKKGTLAVAKRMLAKGIDLALICEVTGLRAAQVKKLATT